jgi:hypothetical protein
MSVRDILHYANVALTTAINRDHSEGLSFTLVKGKQAPTHATPETEAHALRRYPAELELRRRDLSGE